MHTIVVLFERAVVTTRPQGLGDQGHAPCAGHLSGRDRGWLWLIMQERIARGNRRARPLSQSSPFSQHESQWDSADLVATSSPAATSALLGAVGDDNGRRGAAAASSPGCSRCAGHLSATLLSSTSASGPRPLLEAMGATASTVRRRSKIKTYSRSTRPLTDYCHRPPPIWRGPRPTSGPWWSRAARPRRKRRVFGGRGRRGAETLRGGGTEGRGCGADRCGGGEGPIECDAGVSCRSGGTVSAGIESGGVGGRTVEIVPGANSSTGGGEVAAESLWGDGGQSSSRGWGRVRAKTGCGGSRLSGLEVFS